MCIAAGRGLSSVDPVPRVRDGVEDPLCFPFFLLLQLATAAKERLEMGPEEVCLNCSYIAL